MALKVGTFNLNNLFDRFNFEVEINALPPEERAIHTETEIVPGEPPGRARSFKGRLIKEKPLAERLRLAERIREMDLDVLCAQEVEDIVALRAFAGARVKDGGLRGRYPHLALIEGNDPRFIDVAVLSKRPLGAVTSWQHIRHPNAPGERVFSRDLLEVDVLADDGEVILKVFTTHLKSKLVPFGARDPEGEHRANDERRHRQAEAAAAIIARQTTRRSPFVVLGDLNDAPEAAPLAPLTRDPRLKLRDGLADVRETRPFAADPPPPGPRWTHRFRDSAARTTHYELFDQIWISPALRPHLAEAWIDRRRKATKDGSDHDPAWVVLDGID